MDKFISNIDKKKGRVPPAHKKVLYKRQPPPEKREKLSEYLFLSDYDRERLAFLNGSPRIMQNGTSSEVMPTRNTTEMEVRLYKVLKDKSDSDEHRKLQFELRKYDENHDDKELRRTEDIKKELEDKKERKLRARNQGESHDTSYLKKVERMIQTKGKFQNMPMSDAVVERLGRPALVLMEMAQNMVTAHEKAEPFKTKMTELQKGKVSLKFLQMN